MCCLVFFPLRCAATGERDMSNISIVSQSNSSFCCFPVESSCAQFTQIQSDTNQRRRKKTSNPISWLWNIPLNVLCFSVKSFGGSHSHRCRAVLSLKQLIHSGITKAQGLIEMFSHFSVARRRIVNHSSVVYSEISFGV